MRIFVGDDTGLLKGVDVSEVSTLAAERGSTAAAAIAQRWGSQGRDERVCRLCWAAADAAERHGELAVAHSGGRLELRRAASAAADGALASWKAPPAAVRGLGVAGSAEHDWRLVSCTEEGVVRTWRRRDAADAADGEAAGWDSEWATCGLSGKPLGDATSVSRMRVDRAGGGRLALGGREKELAVWDIARQTALFTAKNVPNDMLNLRVPVWNADLDFRTGSDNELLAATAAREIRHYDLREGRRRPVYTAAIDGTKMDVGDCRLSALALYGEHLAVVGDVVGGLSLFDLRQRQSCGCAAPAALQPVACRVSQPPTAVRHRAMAGGGGSVRDIAVDEARGSVACCGCDRYLRVYSVRKSRELLHKIYLKQRLNCLLVVPSPEAEQRRRQEKAEQSSGATEGGKAKADGGKSRKKKRKAAAALDPLAAMEAAFGGETDATTSAEEDEDSDSDSDEGVEEGAAAAQPQAQDEAEQDGDDDETPGVAAVAEENDQDFMQWVLGGAAEGLGGAPPTHPPL